jgi:hypothetical protein
MAGSECHLAFAIHPQLHSILLKLVTMVSQHQPAWEVKARQATANNSLERDSL